MPKYQVELSDGRKFEVEADAPPSESDVLGAIGGAPMAAHDAAAGPARTWTDTAVDALPALGGAAGGIVGGIGGTVAGFGVGGVPGAVGGAALGGGFGEAAKQLVDRYRGHAAPATMTDAAAGIGTQGAIQGAAELAGQGIGKGLQYAGGRLYSLALRPAESITSRFGDVSAMGLKEGVPIKSAQGVLKAKTLQSASKQASRQLVADSGAVIPTSVATRGFDDITAEAAQRASVGMADDTADIAARAAAIQKNYPNGIPASVADTLKTTMQKASDAAYKTARAGGPVRGVDAEMNMATASGLKGGLEEAIPGVGDQNARTQTLMGLRKALGKANLRQNDMSRALIPLALSSGGASYTGATGDKRGLIPAAIGAALMSPGSMSRAGILLDRTGGSGVTQQAIRTALRASGGDESLRAALMALMTGQSGEP